MVFSPKYAMSDNFSLLKLIEAEPTYTAVYIQRDCRVALGTCFLSFTVTRAWIGRFFQIIG